MRKLFVSVLAVALSAALIYGATMAWFTDTATVGEATFTAGTVIVSTDEEVTITPATSDNVNPGDTFTASWNIVNEGTKAVMLRVLADIQYMSADGTTALSTDNITGLTLPTGWTCDGVDKNATAPGLQLELYYNPVVLGTMDDGENPAAASDAARTVLLSVTGTFDGATTTNMYQGSVLTINGAVQAIQASHSADWEWDEEFTPIELTAQGANFAVSQAYKSVSAEFNILDCDMDAIDSVVVELYAGSTKLATKTAVMNVFSGLGNGDIGFSTQFYVNEADASSDPYWIYDILNAAELSEAPIPTKAVLIVTDINGGVHAAETTQALNSTAWANLF